MSSISRVANSSNVGSFEPFLEGWLARQQSLLNELIRAQENFDEFLWEAEIRDLIARAMAHVQEYYREKSRMIRRNVFHVFSPYWLTPLERALLWIAGFNPESAFKLVICSVNDLTEDQSQRIDNLILEKEEEEKLLEDQLVKIQESLAAPPLAGLAREEGRRQLVDGEIRESEMPIRLRADMESLVVDADSLRKRVVQELVEILYPMQNVRFMAAAVQLHLRIRVVGQHREAEQLRRGEENGL